NCGCVGILWRLTSVDRNTRNDNQSARNNKCGLDTQKTVERKRTYTNYDEFIHTNRNYSDILSKTTCFRGIYCQAHARRFSGLPISDLLSSSMVRPNYSRLLGSIPV